MYVNYIWFVKKITARCNRPSEVRVGMNVYVCNTVRPPLPLLPLSRTARAYSSCLVTTTSPEICTPVNVMTHHFNRVYKCAAFMDKLHVDDYFK